METHCHRLLFVNLLKEFKIYVTQKEHNLDKYINQMIKLVLIMDASL